MYDKRAEVLAAKFGILDKMQNLENALLDIDGISEIKFDIDNYPDLRQVILIPRYEVRSCCDSYFIRRRSQLEQIISTCLEHGLCGSGDMIEDYGEHWYIVRDCDRTWPAYHEGLR